MIIKESSLILLLGFTILERFNINYFIGSCDSLQCFKNSCLVFIAMPLKKLCRNFMNESNQNNNITQMLLQLIIYCDV